MPAVKNRPALPRRRSLRLQGYHYAAAGAYFVTVCTHHKLCLFGEVKNGAMHLNDAGRLIASIWAALPQQHTTITLDEFVVMPNHLHGIIVLGDGADKTGVMNHAPTKSAHPTLGEIIRGYKSRCTLALRRAESIYGLALWQRNYYEHVIRDDMSLREIREYIVNNPLQWHLDGENPRRVDT